ncbi:MAG: rod shape-determining protein MreC [Venatoribacter sp.]
MWVDHNYSWLQSVRYLLGYVLLPAQQVASMPNVAGQWIDELTVSREKLQSNYNQLQARNLVLELQSQRLQTLKAENAELRELLNASEQLDDRVLVSSIVSIDSDPFSQEVQINKGGKDGVFIGQPVLDAYGLVGQVVDVFPYSARVSMIADANHAVPVRVNRNGVRAIAQGTGSLTELELIYVPTTADIVEGDLLVTSGLGGRYPRGYPVATVTQVDDIPGEAFAHIKAQPSAQLDRSRLLILVFNQGASNIPEQDIWRGQ